MTLPLWQQIGLVIGALVLFRLFVYALNPKHRDKDSKTAEGDENSG